jgi:ABC-type transport system involved in multi-copper enzyme maturation permease subunit
MTAWVIGGRFVRELAFSPKGLLWLPTSSVVLSVLLYLFLTNADLSLLDQRTMMFMTAQAVVLLGLLAATITAVDAVAGERERGTLEPLLVSPVTSSQLLTGYLIGAVAMWAATAIIGLPYLVVASAGSGSVLVSAAYLLVTGSLLALGMAAWTIGFSAWVPTVRTGLLVALIVYAGLAAPALLSSALRGNWVGRAFDVVNPFANAMNTLDSVIIDEQGFALQRLRLLGLAVFAGVGLLFAWRRLTNLSLE